MEKGVGEGMEQGQRSRLYLLSPMSMKTGHTSG